MRQWLRKRATKLIALALSVLIVAAFLAGPFKLAKGRARQSSCQSNLKHIGIAFTQYVRDYDERFPPAPRWSKVLLPYGITESVFRCPARPELANGYAYHARVPQQKSYGRVTNSHSLVLGFDSEAGTPNPSDLGTSLPKPARHFDGNNILYVDGHVKVRSTQGFRTDFTSLRRLWLAQDIQEIKSESRYSPREKQTWIRELSR